MTEWFKIGCAVDFSELSRLAMLEAADLAKRAGAELVLVHAFRIPRESMVARDMLAPNPAAVTAEISGELDRKLEGWRDEASRLRGAPVEAKVLMGDPADEVSRFASKEHVDLLVVATHGRRGLARAVLGSVAATLVREAPCSVLVVRRQPEED